MLAPALSAALGHTNPNSTKHVEQAIRLRPYAEARRNSY